ncbi:MAG: hypothetical protein AB1540_05850 [Bdellovibrionota bacterium]
MQKNPVRVFFLVLLAMFTAPYSSFAAPEQTDPNASILRSAHLTRELTKKQEALRAFFTKQIPETQGFIAEQNEVFYALGRLIGHLMAARSSLLEQIEAATSSGQVLDTRTLSTTNTEPTVYDLKRLKRNYVVISALLEMHLSHHSELDRLNTIATGSQRNVTAEQHRQTAKLFRTLSTVTAVGVTISGITSASMNIFSWAPSATLNEWIMVGSAINAGLLFVATLVFERLNLIQFILARDKTRLTSIIPPDKREPIEFMFKGIAEEYRIKLPQTLEQKLNWLGGILERQKIRSLACERQLVP